MVQMFGYGTGDFTIEAWIKLGKVHLVTGIQDLFCEMLLILEELIRCKERIVMVNYIFM